ncbi:amino acid ABC transporter permease [[Clostridium] polysaccharolyticum]|uniref:Polar amino acid transport system permease protein n=1 Tax=[Clostridium] polysaccharolyticum TaxID=29364 RepID=A0A1I0EQW6_9FIRM|nr:amino acid ABC transporter permease [[Clostridium] polysaccharolyticum]SET47914.1 polar amino acid transport system permease protein [[Clostridium] polysaccharolyticum]
MKLIDLLVEFGGDLLSGLGVTLQLAITGIIFASIIGIVCAIINVSKNKYLKIITSIYINIIRGTPFLVQAYIIYFGLPGAFGIRMSELTAGIIAISLNAGAYMAEIIRGGIEAVDKGQMEAARSLGLSSRKAMRKIILPQALRTMTPSLINQFIITLKDTSILSIIGIRELTMAGKLVIAKNYESMAMWSLVALYYFIIIYVITKISRYIERKTAYGK